MQSRLDRILASSGFWLLARLCLALMFLCSGLAKVLDWQGGLQEMQGAGLNPPWLFNLATASLLLLGSALLLLDRALWLGAAALAVFLLLTIPLVHHFWLLEGSAAQLSLYFALEHLAVVGGLMAVAIASRLRQLLVGGLV
ncbi:DoxX family membrane protein [Gallaecimonas xiamenensis]|uniref:DoxX family membrane protein n=1 Tax=Gallaecimonas xiamenensis TaxID=1207039 RepID=UPI0005562C04|nr:DoxX family membrane protein [Gallaecimonas xiamenensis]